VTVSLPPSQPRGVALPVVAGDDHTDVTSVPVPWEGHDDSHDPDATKQTGIIRSLDDYNLEPGTALGEYRIEGKIGQGGMGVVFSAVHPLIGKRAAIKILKKELCADPHTLERFVDEARVVNQIGHPNIVDVFAFGELPDGRSYFVMEWLKGETLRARIARSSIDAAEVHAIIRPLARALEAAHEKGVIHRDLKPDNVFLVAVRGEVPTVKLLDFGIAKLARNDHRVEKTATGAIVGTPQYIAPEQAKGYAIDHRADIYALGGIIYELLTGRPPFVADNAMEMVAKHLMETPLPPSHFAPSVAPELDSLVLRMLAKTPDGRPPLTEVCEVIERAKTRASIQPPFSADGTVRAPLAADASAPVQRTSLETIASSGALAAVSQAQPDVQPRRRLPLWIAIVGVPLAGLAAFLVVSATGGGGSAKARSPAAVESPAAVGSSATIASPTKVETPATVDVPARVGTTNVASTAKVETPAKVATPSRGAPHAKAKLRLTIAGSRAPVIFIDGKRSTAEVKLRPGLHEIEIRAPRMQTQRLQVDVAPNAVTTKRIVLTQVPKPSADPPKKAEPPRVTADPPKIDRKVDDDGSELLSPGSLSSPPSRR